MATVLIGALCLGLVVLAARSVYKQRKGGGCGCGCSGCDKDCNKS